jgi:hypothetical protein
MLAIPDTPGTARLGFESRSVAMVLPTVFARATAGAVTTDRSGARWAAKPGAVRAGWPKAADEVVA